MIKQRLRTLCGPPLQMLGYRTGLMRLTARIRQIEGAIILMYHSVADEKQSEWIDPDNHVPSKIFEHQMDFLSQNRNVISLDNLVTTLRQGRSPPTGSIVITFDDGYLDNLTIAAPILDRYNFSATLFLPSAYIDRNENQWIDQVYTAFKFRTKNKLTWGAPPTLPFILDNPIQHRAGYMAVCASLLISDANERKTLLADLNSKLRPASLSPRLIMDWDDVRTLLTDHKCFSIGGHTKEHTDLTSVTENEAKDELEGCIKRIEKELQITPTHFSFCYGRSSEILRHLVAEAGFEAACGGCGLDPVINSPSNLFDLPRVTGPATMKRFKLLTTVENTGIWRKLVR